MTTPHTEDPAEGPDDPDTTEAEPEVTPDEPDFQDAPEEDPEFAAGRLRALTTELPE